MLEESVYEKERKSVSAFVAVVQTRTPVSGWDENDYAYLAELAHAFPMRVIYHSRKPNPNAPKFCEYFADVEEMIRQTDVLSVHVPLREETVGLVGEKWIRLMKKGSVIVNTARGKVIDEEAMIRALEDGHVSSLWLDSLGVVF